MQIAIGNDHAGYELKLKVVEWLKNNGHEVNDFGCYNEQSCDYADYSLAVANAVVAKKCQFGVLICGTGIGISIAANKVNGIRCATCCNEFTAEATRLHNDANILSFGSRVVDEKTAVKMVEIFLKTSFEGGRHIQRVAKITNIENNR